MKDILNRLTKQNGVQWYGHVLRRNSADMSKRTLEFDVVGRRGHG